MRELATRLALVACTGVLVAGCGDAQLGNAVYLYAGSDAVAGNANVTVDADSDPEEVDFESDGSARVKG